MSPALSAAFAVFGSVNLQKALADEGTTTATPEKVELGPPPVDFGLTNNYYTDAQKVCI